MEKRPETGQLQTKQKPQTSYLIVMQLLRHCDKQGHEGQQQLVQKLLAPKTVCREEQATADPLLPVLIR